MTLDLPFETVKSPTVYRFLWIGKQGPVVRRFLSPHALDGYVREVKQIAPEVELSWKTPLVAVGCFP